MLQVLPTPKTTNFHIAKCRNIIFFLRGENLFSKEVVTRATDNRNLLRIICWGTSYPMLPYYLAFIVMKQDIYIFSFYHFHFFINIFINPRWSDRCPCPSFYTAVSETIGGTPYPGINGREIANKLQKGYRMPKPKHVDQQL